MDPQFRTFLETSCFSPQCSNDYDTTDHAYNDAETKRDLIRKLSFRDNFDFSNNSTDDSDEHLTDLFFTNRRKMTNEFLMSNMSPKKFCMAIDTDKCQDSEHHVNCTSKHPQILVSAPSQQNNDFDNYCFPQISTFSTNNTMMEEEYQEIPTVQDQCQLETPLTEKIDDSNLLSPERDNTEPVGHHLEVQTNFGFHRQSESPSSCKLKSSTSVPGWRYESPEKRYNNSSLETCKNLSNPDLRTISAETLVDVMNNTEGTTFLIIDCRYEYEYRGGHIRGAINMTSPHDIEELLIENRHLLFKNQTLDLVKQDWQMALEHPRARNNFSLEDLSEPKPPIIIFHCEFSQKRGPRALRALRNLDRTLNHTCWPNLYYPEVYILENGYKNFHSKFPEHCDPINQYIRMVDKAYKSIYTEAKARDRDLWKKKDSMEPSQKPPMLQRYRTMYCL